MCAKSPPVKAFDRTAGMFRMMGECVIGEWVGQRSANKSLVLLHPADEANHLTKWEPFCAGQL
jgi:hypothetical protein